MMVVFMVDRVSVPVVIFYMMMVTILMVVLTIWMVAIVITMTHYNYDHCDSTNRHVGL